MEFPAMFDLVDSKVSEDVILDFHAKNKLITGVCHGPATFSRLTLPGSKTMLLHGHKVTGVSNKECEILFPVSGIVEPFSVEDELNKATGGQYERAEPFNSRVVVSKGPDGRVIITGQNPASGMNLGKAIYEKLFGTPYTG
jgi:putative intracellular protease/amidase